MSTIIQCPCGGSAQIFLEHRTDGIMSMGFWHGGKRVKTVIVTQDFQDSHLGSYVATELINKAYVKMCNYGMLKCANFWKEALLVLTKLHIDEVAAT